MPIPFTLCKIRFPFAFGFLLVVVIAGHVAKAEAQTVIPAQFIAKMYTEALGRGPDQGGWSRYVEYFERNGCGAEQLSRIGWQFYTSQEFAADYDDNEAKVLALYRGALNRDPDQEGFNHYVSLLNSGARWESVVSDLFSNAEFVNNVARVCNSSTPNYDFGDQVPPMPTPGSNGFTGTQSELQSVLNNATSGSTVYLAQKAVITLTATLNVPSGITVTTYGKPETTSYALMARLVRASTFNGPNVAIAGQGKLTHVWVDGQRHVLGYHKIAGGAQDNANVVTEGGANIVVSSSKLSDPQGGTNFFSVGGDSNSPCSNQTVRRNLITAFSSNHGFVDNSDGLTMNCEGLDLEGNSIVDVSDVAIVLFASPGVTQHSKITNNTIVSAGLSINAPISSDPSTGNPGGSTLDYNGTIFRNNVFWTGPYTTFDFGIEAGGREFFATAANNSDGLGASYVNNTTGWLSARVRAGIAVAGMLDVTITNDDDHPLHFIPVGFASGSPAAVCPGGGVIVEASVGHASGTYPTPSFDGNFDGCVGGLVPPGELRVTASPLTYAPQTRTFNGTITVQNVSNESIIGPFEIFFAGLTRSATLINASGAVQGTFFIKVPSVSALAPSQSAVVDVQFANSSSAPITFKPVIYSGIPN